MLIRIKNIILSGLLLVGVTACYKDNYEGPNANFHGRLLHYQTGAPIYSEQPEGFQIRFTELSWGPNVTQQNFWGKYDGSFNWDYLFGYDGPKYDGSPYTKATYSVEPYDGAFVVSGDKPSKTIEVGPGDKVEVNFDVIPFVNIYDDTYTLEGNVLTVRFKMKREAHPGRNIDMAGLLASSRTQYLSYKNAGGYEGKYSSLKTSVAYENYQDGTEVTETVVLDAGKKYWFRIGARLSGQERWNFTKIIEIQVP